MTAEAALSEPLVIHHSPATDHKGIGKRVLVIDAPLPRPKIGKRKSFVGTVSPQKCTMLLSYILHTSLVGWLLSLFRDTNMIHRRTFGALGSQRWS